jgi:hypothetical protein
MCLSAKVMRSQGALDTAVAIVTKGCDALLLILISTLNIVKPNAHYWYSVHCRSHGLTRRGGTDVQSCDWYEDLPSLAAGMGVGWSLMLGEYKVSEVEVPH